MSHFHVALRARKCDMKISDRIRIVRKRLDMEQAEMATHLGIPLSTYSKYERGERAPGNALDKFNKVGINANWLLTGEGEIMQPNIKTADTAYVTEPIKPLVSGSGIHSGYTANDHPHRRTGDASDTIYIESFPEVRAAAGAGQVTPTDQMVVNVRVNAVDWRNYVGLSPKNVKVITVHGDSMKPTLHHGDQILVDTACHHFTDDAIYVFLQGDMLRVKRVQLNIDGSIDVKSDNAHGFETKSYSATDAAEFNIVGKVIPFKFGRFDL